MNKLKILLKMNEKAVDFKLRNSLFFFKILSIFIDFILYIKLLYYTLTDVMICEIADTPTGVVMSGYQVTRNEHYRKPVIERRKNSWQKSKRLEFVYKLMTTKC